MVLWNHDASPSLEGSAAYTSQAGLLTYSRTKAARPSHLRGERSTVASQSDMLITVAGQLPVLTAFPILPSTRRTPVSFDDGNIRNSAVKCKGEEKYHREKQET